VNVRQARIIGDQAVCWNCPCHLGQIVNGLEEPRVFAPRAFYRSMPIPDALAALGIRTILMIPKRVKMRLHLTDLPFVSRRRQRMTDGRVPKPQSGIYAFPVLMPCWRPECGEANRVEPLTER
jgi:hypothetical protein